MNIQNVLSALNSLFENIKKDGAGNVTTPEAAGNIILDFVGSDEHDVNIYETDQGSFTSEDGKNIFWNPNEGLHVTKGEDDISPATNLAHEFGHSWVAQFSPIMNNKMENFGGTPGNTDPEHDKFILPFVQNKFAESRMEGIRKKY